MSNGRRCALAATIVLLALSSLTAQSAKFDSLLTLNEFVEDWKISKQFTLDVANAMPADSYNFKPNPDEMTFAEQLAHIAVGNAFRFQQITGIPAPFDPDPSKTTPLDKQSVTTMLAQSFDYVVGVLPQITPRTTQAHLAYSVLETPHRSRRPRHDPQRAHPHRPSPGPVRSVPTCERYQAARLHVLNSMCPSEATPPTVSSKYLTVWSRVRGQDLSSRMHLTP